MTTPDTTTEDSPGGPRRPRVLFNVGGTVFEFVRKLEVRSTGELLMLVRRRYRDGQGGLVVVKRLRSPATFVERRRLVEEVGLTFRFKHPNIAQVHQIKMYRGSPHVVMEYVEGRSLDTLLNLTAMRRRPVSSALAAFVVAEVADALHHAHCAVDDWNRPLGIVHRDVSPRNIRVGTHGDVKLTNFTVAASRMPGREQTSRPLVKGDVAYASPEMLLRATVDARSDLFSLGLVLLELLTGRHPLAVEDSPPPPLPEGLTLEAQGPTWMPVEEVAARMLNLSPEQVARLVEGIPEGVASVVLRALRREPSERFQSAEEMACVLRGWLRAHAPGFGRHETAEEVARVAMEATVRRNQAELLEGGLHPENLTAEEASVPLEPGASPASGTKPDTEGSLAQEAARVFGVPGLRGVTRSRAEDGDSTVDGPRVTDEPSEP
ncbi:serine/threonine-protein kinase [Myxococcus stipitatus]|uniref:serine/threonine-protein kinase n=1 Tax=Myxococcus stipitatus TaxID=83455 RepID=UPI0030CFA8B8